MACDLIVAADDARLGEPEIPVRVGARHAPHALRDRSEADPVSY